MSESYSTEYNKGRMTQIKDDFELKIKRYAELIENLSSNVNNIGQYWISSDVNSNDAYQNLKSKYAKYKASLEEGQQLLKDFANGIDSQIQRYEEAEARINNIINEN